MQYIEYIDFRVLCLLLCLMAVVAGFKSIGVFETLTYQLLCRIRSGRILAVTLVMLPFFSSMFVTNDVALIIFIPIGLLFKLFKWSGLAAFLLALLIAWVVKFAFMDSYIMCQMMVSYMQVAPTTVITFDLYSKLCNVSGKFRELFKKGQEEDPRPAYAAAAAPSAPVTPAAEPAAKPVFCGQCGSKNEPGKKFCGQCGSPM